MTMRVLPLVQDPVLPDLDDLVIKEAKRRARRRRMGYLAVGAMAATLVGVAAACGPLHAVSPIELTTPSFTGLPPADAVPSSPVAGVLSVEYPSEHVRAWVFADGRLITMRMIGPFKGGGWPNSGFLEQRLTPSGVEMIRAYVLAHAGDLVEETQPENERIRDLRIRLGDRQYQRGSTAGADWRCHWAGCEEYISKLNETLPASAWADKEYRQYVPSQYRICAIGGIGGKGAPAELVRAALPLEVRELLLPGARVDKVSNWGWGCVHVSPDAAQTAQASMVAAGFPVAAFAVKEFTFTIPAPDGPDYLGAVWVGPVLPNGDAEENGG